MFKVIPWDIWAAAILAVIVILAMIFDARPAVFIAVYISLCAYVVIETFTGAPG